MTSIDPGTLNWADVESATYRIKQHFRYEYPGPIFDLEHRLMVVPPLCHIDQSLISQDLTVDPQAPSQLSHDAFGNHVVTLQARRIEASFEVGIEATVQRTRRPCAHQVPLSPPSLDAFRGVSALTRPCKTLADAAAELRARYADDRELAEAIVAFVSGQMAYVKGVTDVGTDAATAFAAGRGVCQDFTHVALALARSCGLAARYVSGHLLGEGATHAWVEFLIAGENGETAALSYDPTYGIATSLRYVVVAVGRDYRDVAPTSGCYRAPYAGTLSASTRVDVTAAVFA